VVWQAESLPFGEPVSVNEDVDGDGVAVTNNLRFPGQYQDQETGLHYNMARDYWPMIGRYVEADPIGQIGDIALYPYVGGNPLTRSDLGGLQTVPIPGPVPVPIPLPPGVIPGTPENQQLAKDTAEALRQLEQAIRRIIENLKKCECCEPCTPYPAGTIGYEGPHYSHPAPPAGIPHLHLAFVNQIPWPNCGCRWDDIARPHGFPPPPLPGWVDLNNGRPPLSPSGP